MHTPLKDIIYEWQHNLEFREAFNKDPQQALLDRGFQVSPDDLNKIRAKLTLDKSKNHKLDDRMSK